MVKNKNPPKDALRWILKFSNWNNLDTLQF